MLQNSPYFLKISVLNNDYVEIQKKKFKKVYKDEAIRAKLYK